MKKVIHLLPYDGIGGAEAAARSMAEAPPVDIDFHLRFIFPHVRSRNQRGATFNPLTLLSSTLKVLGERPDLLVCSLWRSCIVGILVKLRRPGTRLAVFIHNSVDAHQADRVVTRLAMALAEAVWVDSEASLRLRFRKMPRAPVTVIPFLARQLDPALEEDSIQQPTPTFVFWGRLAAQKNLRNALQLFAAVRRVAPDACFTVIGPDSGELPVLRAWCRQTGIDDAVRFTGPMDFDGIRASARDHAFYLQTSNYEGMAMSVVEAMQLGLVPVVTPVGEIARYCRDGENAVLVANPEDAASRVLGLLQDPARWRAMRQRAIATWRGQPLYGDAVAAACRTLITPREP